MSFEKYTLIKKIQENRSKVRVDLVKDTATGKKYVMKSIPALKRESKNGIKEEVQIMNRMNHRNVMKVEQYSENVEINGKTVDFYLMEYASNDDLFNMLQQYQHFKQKLSYIEIPNSSDSSARQEFIETLNYAPCLPLFMVKHIAKEVGFAVQCLHQEIGVAHMDIKLENVMIKENYEIVLSDFGQTLSTRTRQTKPRGTEFYMSPEVFMNYKCNNQKDYDPKLADSFSFGVLVYALTFGLFPWKYASLFDSQYRMFVSNPQQFWKLKMQNMDCRIKKEYIAFVEILEGLLQPEDERITIEQFLERLEQMDSTTQMFNREFLDQVYNDNDMYSLLEMVA